MITNPVFLGLLSAFFGAVTNILAKTVIGFAKPRNYISINFTIIFLLLLPFAPRYFYINFTFLSIGLVIAISMIDGWANYFYFKSFETGDPGTISGLLSLSPMFSLVVLPLFPKITPQDISILGIMGILIILIGVIVINRQIYTEHKTNDQPAQRINRFLFL